MVFDAVCWGRRWRAFALTALVVFVLSCASDEPLAFRFDADATADERRLFAERMEAWNVELLPDHKFSVDPNGAWRVTFTNDLLAQGLDGRTCGDDPSVPDCAFEHWIRVRRGYAEPRTKEIITHEQGHALGIHWHIKEPGHVMSTGDGLTTFDLTEADREACRGVGSCGSIVSRRLP